jgi:subtilisin family serine protease
MARMLADRPSVLRYVLFALALAGVGTATQCDGRRYKEYARVAPEPRTAIHFKYREGQVHALGIGEKPLFTSRPLLYKASDIENDPRTRWRRVEVPPSQADDVLARLQRDPSIEQAFVPPTVTLPRSRVNPRHDEGPSCPIHTPSYEKYQGYIGPAPAGIDAPAAWRRDVRGQGVWFADVEGGWNAKHEDLPGDRIFHAGGRRFEDPMWRAHGTAVLGEVVGRDNGKGVVGIAPDIERVWTSSIGQTSVANALDTAAEHLRPGDVLLIELQGGGPRGRYLPVEFWDDNYDAIKVATDRGIIVIEAAGNGGEDLDHPAYKSKFDRWNRDSGAILVGAGGPAREGWDDRARLDFSNYGARVDVQGWGRKVATLDYGDLQRCDDAEGDWRYTDRHYTDEFSGTSSASPIVAGSAVLLQSYAKQKGVTLLPNDVRTILRQTGTPQIGDTSEQIGPRPDLAKALQVLEQRALDRAGILDW